jgi:hypothetical protein
MCALKKKKRKSCISLSIQANQSPCHFREGGEVFQSNVERNNMPRAAAKKKTHNSDKRTLLGFMGFGCHENKQ